MSPLDPSTSRPLPDSAIQRILFVAQSVHVYQIPPITSTRGFAASSWTSPTQPTAQQIFTCRLRIVETSNSGKIKADVVLEDANTGDLFAAAPYTSAAVVQQATDSSRFFAIRVQGEGGMKATLGLGFEDRSPAFDFGVALGEVRKVLELENAAAGPLAGRSVPLKLKPDQEVKKDFSLKDGEQIHVQVGSRGRRAPASGSTGKQDDTAALFSIAPPPPPAAKPSDFPHIAPPSAVESKSAQELGFDDGEFGEFQ